MSKINFGGIRRNACLEYTPEAKPGDYVLVHVGFALSIIDEHEALRALSAISAEGKSAELKFTGENE